MPDALIVAAHHAEWHHRATVLRQHTWDNRMQRPFARRDAVRMARFDDEAITTIVQHHAGFRAHDSAAIAGEQRVDEANRVAVLVDDAKIDRVRMGRERIRRRRRHRTVGDNNLAQLIRPLRGQHPVDRHLSLTRVGHRIVAVTVSDARRLDQQMEPLSRCRIHVREIVAGQDI